MVFCRILKRRHNAAPSTNYALEHHLADARDVVHNG